MTSDRRWRAALAEHAAAVDAFVAELARVAPADWTRAPRAGAWSPAEVALHVARSYELGRDAAAGAPAMRMRVTRWQAWLGRVVLLPAMFATGRFPHGAKAPREVRPDAGEAERATAARAVARLRQAADAAATALHLAARARPTLRITHAYFGPLRPLAALRLLGAHTRHHARGLARLRYVRTGDRDG